MFPGVMDQINYKGTSLPISFIQQNNSWWSIILLAIFNVCDTIGRTLPGKLVCCPPKFLLVRSFLLRFAASCRVWCCLSLFSHVVALTTVPRWRCIPCKCATSIDARLQLPTLLRFGFIPIFLGCAHNWTDGFNDYLAVALMIFFSFSNGYLASRTWTLLSCVVQRTRRACSPASLHSINGGLTRCFCFVRATLLLEHAVAMMFGPQRADPHEREVAGFLMSFFLQAGIFIGSQIALGFK